MQNEKPRVLYIDDEDNNLVTFKAAFRRDFQIEIANSAEKGYAILKEKSFHVIIADQKMPQTTGVEFFTQIREEYPEPIRILLTGFSDIDSVIDAINKGQIFRYLTKPWDENELKLSIENAYNLYRLKEENETLNSKVKNLFSKSSDAIFLADEDLNLTDANDAFCNMFDVGKDQFGEYNLKQFIIIPEKFEELVLELKTQNHTKDYEINLKDLNGNLLEGLITVNGLKDSTETTTSYQGIIKDLSESNRTKKLLIRKVIETQEKERERFSRDLHDDLGQKLSGMKFYLEIMNNTDPNSKEFDKVMRKSRDILDNIFPQLRNMCFNLMPRTMEIFGLSATIAELCKKLEVSDFLSFDLDIYDELPEVDKSMEIALFRVIQEFINNSIKHGEASKISISLKYDNQKININLKDNGVGFDVNELSINSMGMGLKNIQSRVESYNGVILMNSSLGAGTHYKISIPLDKAFLSESENSTIQA